MPTHVVLLRGVNLGARNKVPMARLRELLTELGYAEVRTFLQSGNVLLSSRRSGSRVAADVRAAIAGEWSLDIPVITRTVSELGAVLAADPLPGASADPRCYLVTFLDAPLSADGQKRLETGEFGDEQWAVIGREVYTWTARGIHDAKVIRALGSKAVGATGTARNWDTVRKLHALALDG
ncbi:DUF1697 domain-containing protein [Calidifontibacter sp. DB0510]|uniref:DUF1697 domain-containing protein n=1 Tax=Metallococcus carri TaxID=1656884 RepID=A0A967B7I6_9MICO|nr:DUF1697 domain-containing protein [Metallococcus carri]NHN57012.1 DUF1697 domain-containing protein [Metallococcus carri]NOP37757.1 DUF1697 domain-containing protein [Calidifontibacter sp. DB2511S]